MWYFNFQLFMHTWLLRPNSFTFYTGVTNLKWHFLLALLHSIVKLLKIKCHHFFRRVSLRPRFWQRVFQISFWQGIMLWVPLVWIANYSVYHQQQSKDVHILCMIWWRGNIKTLGCEHMDRMFCDLNIWLSTKLESIIFSGL